MTTGLAQKPETKLLVDAVMPVREGDLVLLVEKSPNSHCTLLQYGDRNHLFKKRIIHMSPPTQNGAFNGATILDLRSNVCKDDYTFQSALKEADEIYVGRKQVLAALKANSIYKPYVKELSDVFKKCKR